MKKLVALVALVGLLGVACVGSAPAVSSSPVASPQVVCDKLAMPVDSAVTSQPTATDSLTCGSAIAAAVAVLAPAHPSIVGEEFRFGGLCPPGAPCVPPVADQGIVIFDFASGPSLFVYVGAGAGGIVAEGSPAPYPSGY